MAQLWKIRLPDGRVLVPGDWTSAEPLFSTVEIGTGAFPVLTAFSYGRGGDVPGSVGPRESTLRDTNLEGEGNRLPENEELVIFNLGIEVFKIGSTVGADPIPNADAPAVELMNMLRLQRDLLVVLKIAYVKEYTHAPLSYWPAGTGVHEYVNAGSRTVLSQQASGTIVGNNGSPSIDEARAFASPLYCAGGESLSVDLKAGPGQVNGLDIGANDRMRLRIYLDGYRRRPVA